MPARRPGKTSGAAVRVSAPSSRSRQWKLSSHESKMSINRREAAWPAPKGLGALFIDEPRSGAMMANTMANWHRVVETRDAAGLNTLLAENAVFHSPVVHTPQVGKAITHRYLTAAFGVLFNESFRYVREIVSDHDAALEFVVEIDGISVNGVDMITWDDDGRISRSEE